MDRTSLLTPNETEKKIEGLHETRLQVGRDEMRQDIFNYLLDSGSTSTNHILVKLLENWNFHTEIGSNLTAEMDIINCYTSSYSYIIKKKV